MKHLSFLLSKRWLLVDAKNMKLGRLASKIIELLRGKHKSTYCPYLNSGDKVVVINISYLLFSSKKLMSKKYFYHTGYPGGLKMILMKNKSYIDILRFAIKKMMPKKKKLTKKQLNNLYLYSEDNYKKLTQKPQFINILRNE